MSEHKPAHIEHSFGSDCPRCIADTAEDVLRDAAPDLLDALESLTAAVALDLHPESVRESLAKARAAIAKARGGNSAAPVVEAAPSWCWACGSSHVPPEVCVPRSE